MPITNIDIAAWEAELCRDRRLSGSAKSIAHCLAEHFRKTGSCQRSIEGIASLAGIVSLGQVRDALAALKLSGWITSERTETTARHGLLYRPVMPQQAEQQATTRHASA
jgi:hypothetical protein